MKEASSLFDVTVSSTRIATCSIYYRLYSIITQANKLISVFVCAKLDSLKIPGIEFLALD